MFGLGGWEIGIILIVALLIFGSRLPGVARNLGKSIRSLKDGLRGIDLNDDSDDTSTQQANTSTATPDGSTNNSTSDTDKSGPA